MRKINFLIVEDNVFDYELCRSVIENHYVNNADIKRVSSLGAAIGEINRTDKKYDIVILDLNVDDSRGIATLQVFSKSCMMPIIVTSGLSDESIIEQSILNGADGYIVKGENSSTMIDNINHALINNKFILDRKRANAYSYS